MICIFKVGRPPTEPGCAASRSEATTGLTTIRTWSGISISIKSHPAAKPQWVYQPAPSWSSTRFERADRGALTPDLAQKLFAAIVDAKTITVDLAYADDSAEILRFQYPADRGKFGPKNSFVAKCLQGEIARPRNLQVVP
jgi:hypothetical protein